MANFTVFRSFKSLRKILLFFLIIPFLTFSQVEISKRKIELLPPVSSALKNAQISPNNPNYFSISYVLHFQGFVIYIQTTPYRLYVSADSFHWFPHLY